jgi:hypothetical protein
MATCLNKIFNAVTSGPEPLHMSALGQKQTFAVQKVMSALSLKADMCGALDNVR